MDSASQQRPLAPGNLSQSQALPSIAALTGQLPSSEHSPVHLRHQSEAREARDSGNWSVSQSKHSSTVSNNTGNNANMGLNVHTLLNPEESPSRTPAPDTPLSSRYPSGVSQQSHGAHYPPMNPGYPDHRLSVDASSHFDSRRSSVDSRMNVGMTQLNITSPSSPYDSQHGSRVSLVSTLQHQRGIPGEQRHNGTSPLSPLSRNAQPRTLQPPKRAPVINPNPRSVSGMPDPMAAAPTKGYAWAFPGDDYPSERRQSSSGESSVDRSNLPSRQNSYATSITSSVMTADSKMPYGQQRLDDGTQLYPCQIIHTNTNLASDMVPTHHHSMQHRSVTSLQSTADHAAAAALAAGNGNYSRTPELRVSHKMAERKRRSEMKGLFDELNVILPNSPGSKSSKWEILTKSIEYIKSLSRSHEAARVENARLRPEAEYARRAQEENEMIRNELSTAWTVLRRLDPSQPHIFGNVTAQLAQSQNAAPTSATNVLPPLQSQQPPPHPQPQPQPPPSQWGAPVPAQMQGIEYGGIRPYDHPHR